MAEAFEPRERLRRLYIVDDARRRLAVLAEDEREQAVVAAEEFARRVRSLARGARMLRTQSFQLRGRALRRIGGECAENVLPGRADEGLEPLRGQHFEQPKPLAFIGRERETVALNK